MPASVCPQPTQLPDHYVSTASLPSSSFSSDLLHRTVFPVAGAELAFKALAGRAGCSTESPPRLPRTFGIAPPCLVPHDALHRTLSATPVSPLLFAPASVPWCGLRAFAGVVPESGDPLPELQRSASHRLPKQHLSRAALGGCIILYPLTVQQVCVWSSEVLDTAQSHGERRTHCPRKGWGMDILAATNRKQK